MTFSATTRDGLASLAFYFSVSFSFTLVTAELLPSLFYAVRSVIERVCALSLYLPPFRGDVNGMEEDDSVTALIGGAGLSSVALASFVSASFASCAWLLSPPSRRVPSSYYKKRPRRFFLTGCASGMGRHLALCLLKRGHFVCATDINENALVEAFSEFTSDSSSRVIVQRLDVRSADQWQAALASCANAWGGLDCVMNIAGCLCPNKIQNATVGEIDIQIDVNVKGVVFGTKYGAEIMQNQAERKDFHGGHIINFSSMAATGTVSGVTLYAASKFACRGFSLAASKDLFDETGVAVTCFMPDAVQTPMVDMQLHYDDAAMAFSGDILTLKDVENCILGRVIQERPVEVWLSSRARVARFGDIFGASRAVQMAERIMKSIGRRRQKRIKEGMRTCTED